MYHTSQEISSNRVRTTYYTRKSLTAVPIGNILHPENNVSDYTITIDGGILRAGMYLYSLIADGQLVDTKQMILTK